MIRSVTPEQMQSIDRTAIHEYGIPGVVLMENAGNAVFRIIISEYESLVKHNNVWVICGQGNNGGDGFVIARHLYNFGCSVHVFFSGDESKLSEESSINYSILKKMNIDIIDSFAVFEKDAADHDIIVDCLFGTGLCRDVKGDYAHYISRINRSSATVVAVDIPSGICGKTGNIFGCAVNADITVTLGCMKTGLLMYPGADHCGTIYCADISLPRELIENEDLKTVVITDELAASIYSERLNNTHKTRCGICLMIAGSEHMTGAARLCGRAVLRSGAGMIYSAASKSVNDKIVTAAEEIISVEFSDTHDLNTIQQYIEKASVLVIGPGWGKAPHKRQLLSDILKYEKPLNIVLDADALNIISEQIDLLKDTHHTIVVTPHIGEMSRLMGRSIEDISSNMVDHAQQFSREYNVIVVLKSARTVIACPEGDTYINISGCSAMATAGMGDVLAGFIAGIWAQTENAEHACIYAVHLHGSAGEQCAAKKGYSLLPSDVVEAAGETMLRISEVDY